jgi:hypothetical protein
MMTRLVFFWLVLAFFPQAELIPGVADEACDLSGGVALQRYRGLGSVMQAQGNAMTVEIPVRDLDESCKDPAACAKRPLRKQSGQGDFYEVITYTL